MPKAESKAGPLYGVELLESLPIGNAGWSQAMPGREELARVAKISSRTVAAYEVLTAQYLRLKAESEKLESVREQFTKYTQSLKDREPGDLAAFRFAIACRKIFEVPGA